MDIIRQWETGKTYKELDTSRQVCVFDGTYWNIIYFDQYYLTWHYEKAGELIPRDDYVFRLWFYPDEVK